MQLSSVVFTRTGQNTLWVNEERSLPCTDRHLHAHEFLGERHYVTFALWHEPSVCRL